jgi:mRNA interferase MazF
MGSITTLMDKKIKLKEIIVRCKGEYEINRFLDICSIPVDFLKTLSIKSDYFYLDKITIQKIVRNANPGLNKKVLTDEFYNLIECENKGIEILRGQLYWIDFGQNTIGSEQGGSRPALVMSNNLGNNFGTTVVVIALTTKMSKASNIPVHVLIDTLEYETGLEQDSIVLTEQIRTVDKKRILGYIGECPFGLMRKIEKAFKIQFGIDNPIDIVDFIEYFAKKRNASDKLKMALAVDFKEYCSEKGIDFKNNINNYTTELKYGYVSQNRQENVLAMAMG